MSLAVGLAAGLAAYIWSGLHQTPQEKDLFACEHRELAPYVGVTPREAILAASAKCQREVRLKYATKP